MIVRTRRLLALLLPLLLIAGALYASQPPAINPFGPRKTEHEDEVPGCAELSDGTIYTGKVYLTRDTTLKIYDDQLKRQREVPLRVVSRIQCEIQKEWLEKEWRFKENAANEKVFTGREYPARQYVHTIFLHDGRQIRGSLSGMIYIQQTLKSKPLRLLMHKRQKGSIGGQLKALVYLRSVELGDEAYQRGKRRAEPPYRNEAKDQDQQEKRPFEKKRSENTSTTRKRVCPSRVTHSLALRACTRTKSNAVQLM